MRQNLKINVGPRNSKTNKQGLQPIYFTIRIANKRYEFSTKKYIDPKTWDHKNSKIKGKTEEAYSINGYLEVIKSKIINLEIQYSLRNEVLTIEEIKQFLNSQGNANKRMLVPIFHQHNDQLKKIINKEVAPGTIERYETTLKHIKEFLKHQYKKEDIAIDDIDHAFIMDLDFYFRAERKCNNNTTVKYIKNFKKIIRECMAKDWIQKDPFVNYKPKVEKVERIFLSQEEIYAIYEKEHCTERLNLV
ncbi:phage integrase SAM-like domain and Arm DNA-binding domain-containing protein [Empedobacter falsenii]